MASSAQSMDDINHTLMTRLTSTDDDLRTLRQGILGPPQQARLAAMVTERVTTLQRFAWILSGLAILIVLIMGYLAIQSLDTIELPHVVVAMQGCISLGLMIVFQQQRILQAQSLIDGQLAIHEGASVLRMHYVHRVGLVAQYSIDTKPVPSTISNVVAQNPGIYRLYVVTHGPAEILFAAEVLRLEPAHQRG